jgi:pilus assembly protein FimV
MALGLGDIHLKSSLNAPLDADIDLTASAEELAGLKVALATRESFSRYGLDYPAYLASVTLLPGKSADGKDVLHVRSRDVVTEPFATLLVEAVWARGRLVREYTVLLDPPVFTGENASQAAAVAAPSTEPQTHAGAVARPAPEAAPSAAAPAPAASAPAPSAAPGSYVVQRGDTLFNIASRNFPAPERERALVAIYRANPQAFEGNMNLLRAGAALQLPDEATVAAIGPGDARAEVGAQYHAWAGSHGGGQLHLVAPSEPGKGTAGSASAGETAALQQRVSALQAQLTESQRLLELKNAELARLQAQLGQGKAAPAPAPSPAAAPPPPVAAPAAPSKPAVGPAPEAPKEPVAEAPVPPPVAAKPAPAPKPQAPAATEGGSMLDWLLSNWYVPLGILAVLLAGLFGWRHMRARQGQEFDRTLDRLSSPPFEAAARSVVRPTETQPMRALQAKEDSSFLVEESGTHEAPRISEEDVGKVQAAPVAVDDTVSGDTAVALDQGDPLAEADFHMAYGLYDQAADLVRIAIAREPQRRDLKLKLLEVFFVWGNKDQFLQLARELSTSRDQALAGEWEKIVIMGRQIAPDDALFASAGALPGAASGGVDLNLEGGQNRVDFDLLGEPSIAAAAATEGVDLDLGAALGDADATGELRAIGDTGVDFVLDDPARGGDATGTTREMPQSQTVTLDMSDSGKESPTVENLQPPEIDSPTIRQKLDASARQHLTGVDQTAELALDDLGLDLAGGSTADTGPHSAATPEESAAPTMLSPLDQDTRELLARTQASSHDTAEMPAAPGSSASGTWLFTDKDFSSVLPQVGAGADSPTELVTAVMPAAKDTSETSVTGQLQALKGKVAGGVDLNLDALATTGETSIPLDLDVGQRAVSGDTAFTATQRLTGTSPQVSEAEPATMSEVGTKLDLARAYMDMGDPEGARSILEEVLAEGSASQKTEARRLIDSLPG